MRLTPSQTPPPTEPSPARVYPYTISIVDQQYVIRIQPPSSAPVSNPQAPVFPMIEMTSVLMQVAVRLVMRIHPNSSLFDIAGNVRGILKLVSADPTNKQAVNAQIALGALSATTLFILRDELHHHDPSLVTLCGCSH